VDILGIIFDLGRVLIKVDTQNQLIQSITKQANITSDEAMQKLVENDIFKQYNKGLLTPNEFHKLLQKEINAEIAYHEFKKIWCSIFSVQDGIETIANTLKQKFKIAILSDTDPLHWEYITTNFPWIKNLGPAWLSYERGIMKPDANSFKGTASLIHLQPEQCLFIDDLQQNVDGAKSIGMHAILFKNVQQLKEELIQLGILK